MPNRIDNCGRASTRGKETARSLVRTGGKEAKGDFEREGLKWGEGVLAALEVAQKGER